MILMHVLYPGQIGIWKKLLFVERGNPVNPEEKNTQSKTRTDNKLNLHMALQWQ